MVIRAEGDSGSTGCSARPRVSRAAGAAGRGRASVQRGRIGGDGVNIANDAFDVEIAAAGELSIPLKDIRGM